GGCYTTPAYRQVRALLSELGLYDRAGVAGRNVFSPDGTEQTFGDWATDQFRQQLTGLRGELPALGVGLFVIRDIWRYNRLHRSIFGRYDGSFPPRPSERGLQELRGTFVEFLERNDLQTLIPVMRLFQSAQGYGYIEEVPAYYGLLWNNPDTMKIVIEQLTGRGRRAGADLTKDGMQTMITEMVTRMRIDVRLHTEVTRIARGPVHRVRTRDRRTGDVLEHDFDLLFVACHAKQALEWLQRPTPREQALFGTLQSHQMTTTLQRGRQPTRNGIDSWLFRAAPGFDHQVITQRLSQFYLDPDAYEAHDTVDPDIRVTFQYGAAEVTEAEVIERYDRNYKTEGTDTPVEDHEVLDRRFWTGYFPHWDEGGIQGGKPWDLLEMQGTDRTYWIGASACFESLRDIVNYNLLIATQHFD
ncbi:MAG: hypothetical protein AAF211_09530, partial [Myxococcota bacterium]